MAKPSKVKTSQPLARRKQIEASATPSFAEIAWHTFNPVAVAEILTGGSETFPHQHELLLRAFGGWVIAPYNTEMRKRAIRIGVRLWLADAEKAVLRKPPEEWAKAEAEARQVLGDDFMREAYYGIGGAAELGVSSTSAYMKEVHDSHLNALETYIDIFQAAHRLCISGKGKKTLMASTIKTYLDNLKLDYKRPHVTLSSLKEGEKAKGGLLKYDTLRRRKYLDMPRTVLLYAAYLCPIAERTDHGSGKAIKCTLLKTFVDPDWKLTFDIPEVTQHWLSLAVFVRDTILPVLNEERSELSGDPFDDSGAAAKFVQGVTLTARAPSPPRPSKSRRTAWAASRRRYQPVK